MDITPAALRALQTQFSGLFQSGYDSVEPFYQQVATVVPSSTKSNTYGWMASIPGMREWIGERVVNNLAAHDFTIKNKRFENTVGVDRDDWEDDNLGVYKPMFTMLGYEARKFPDDVIVALLKTGHAALCFDGQNFFDTDHPQDLNDAASPVYQNYWASGKAFTADNLFDVIRTMQEYKGANGRPLRVRPTHVVHAPKLQQTVKEVLEAERDAAGATNVARGILRSMQIDELAGSGEDDAWYVADLSKPIKPLVWQNRRAAKLTPLTKDDDPNVFMNNTFLWGVDARGNGGYGLPFLIAKAKP
jgi:phage major head subunit gpT-like protein